MQGLSGGYFILPATMPHYLATTELEKTDAAHPAFRETETEICQRTQALLKTDSRRTVESIHRETGRPTWEGCGMARCDANLRLALSKIPEPREEFRRNVRVLRTEEDLNQSLEKVGCVADFLELAKLICTNILHRTESCGSHFRVESQTTEGEARCDDANFCYVAAWQWKSPGPAQGTPGFRVHPPRAMELQVIMNLNLRIWPQKDSNTARQFVTYQVNDVTSDMSFPEMLDVRDEELIGRGGAPAAFEHDCHEGNYGSDGFLINGDIEGVIMHGA